jgi:hypothetical protein
MSTSGDIDAQATADVSPCSRVVILRHHRWRLGSFSIGPLLEVPVRITYGSDSGFTCERLDGQPLENLSIRAIKQLEAAQLELLRDVRRVRVESTSHLRRNPPMRDQPAAGSGTGTIRLAQGESSAQIAALRDQRWRKAVKTQHAALEPIQPQACAPAATAVATPVPSADVVTPFLSDWSNATQDATPIAEKKRESSVFRHDKQEATNRIAKLRQRAAKTQPEAATDATATPLERKRAQDEPGAPLES